MRNLKFSPALEGSFLLDRLETASMLYTRQSDTGILPINFKSDRNNKISKGQFLFLGDTLEDCARLLSRIDDMLPVEWEYDRD